MIVENNHLSEKYKNLCIHLHAKKMESFLSKPTDSYFNNFIEKYKNSCIFKQH